MIRKRASKGPKRPTIKDIAQKAGVSPATVSVVLRSENTSRASRETQEKILKIAKELDYRPNYIARSLVAKETKTIGLVSPTLFNPFYAELANDIIDRAKEKGYGVLARSVRSKVAEERQALRDLLDRGVDGLIVSSALRQDPAVRELARQDPPFVLIMREIEQSEETRSIDFVGVNNYLGGHMAVEHLIEHGHQRIALIMGLQSVSTGYGRYRGALEAMKRHGVTHDNSLTRFGEFDRRAGYRLMADILAKQKPPSAVFAAGDTIAVGVVEALREKGLKVPQDVALIGFDDTELARIPGFDLTTVSQEKAVMGKLGVDYLVNKITGKNKGMVNRTILNPILIVRRSCGCNQSS